MRTTLVHPVPLQLFSIDFKCMHTSLHIALAIYIDSYVPPVHHDYHITLVLHS